MSFGLKKAGLAVVAGYDNDPDCQFAYESNVTSKFYLRDIMTLTASELSANFSGKSPRMIAGCAPCQKYSSLTNKQGRSRSGRWRLVKKFAQLVLEVLPDVVTMENVPNLRKSNEFANFLSGLNAAKYSVWFDVVDCSRFAVPQHRKRLVLLARRSGSIQPLKPQGIEISVRDVIGSLPAIAAGETSDDDPLHRSAGLTAINLQRIRSSRPAGSWKDWPKNLLLECHKQGEGTKYTPVYGRMSWDAPAPTITTQSFNYGSGRFGHPDQDRCISLREAALLQSFPEGYEFHPPGKEFSLSRVAKLIGNAVPPGLAKAIGEQLQDMPQDP